MSSTFCRINIDGVYRETLRHRTSTINDASDGCCYGFHVGYRDIRAGVVRIASVASILIADIVRYYDLVPPPSHRHQVFMLVIGIYDK